MAIILGPWITHNWTMKGSVTIKIDVKKKVK